TGVEASKDVIDEVTRLQRVYQITPNHAAMAGLLQSGVDSAYQVVSLGRPGFVAKCADRLGGEETALMIDSRAPPAYASTLNIALGYLGAKRAPALGGGIWDSIVSPLRDWDQLPGLVSAQATLEELFGNLDYCACDECQSIIGPAAYLVDLLHYLDGQ